MTEFDSLPPSSHGRLTAWAWIERLGRAVAAAFAGGGELPRCPGYFVPGIAVRNILFLLVVLAHGFRRLAPPYSGK